MNRGLDKPDFFLSYASEDREHADRIAEALQRNGYYVVYQGADFRPGESFIANMHQALDEARHVVALLSADYLRKDTTAAEWQAAVADDLSGRRRRLVGVRIHPCEPTGILRDRIYIDLVGLDPERAEKALLNGLARALDGDPAAGPIARPRPKWLRLAPAWMLAAAAVAVILGPCSEPALRVDAAAATFADLGTADESLIPVDLGSDWSADTRGPQPGLCRALARVIDRSIDAGAAVALDVAGARRDGGLAVCRGLEPDPVREAMRRAGPRLVVPVVVAYERNPVRAVGPTTSAPRSVRSASIAEGLVNIRRSGDYVHDVPAIAAAGQRRYFAFGVEAARLARGLESKDVDVVEDELWFGDDRIALRDGNLEVRFRPLRSVVPAETILAAPDLGPLLGGRLVIVGVESEEDRWETPSGLVAGYMLQAHVADTVLSGRSRRRWGTGSAWVGGLAVVGIVCSRRRWGARWSIGLALTWLVVWGLLVAFTQLLAPLMAGLAGVLLGTVVGRAFRQGR